MNTNIYTPQETAAHRLIWAEALESGEYPQTHGTLTEVMNGKVVGHCCLGVGCEVAIKHGLPVKVGTLTRGRMKCHTYDTRSVVLPESVRRWLGLADSSGHLVDPMILEATDGPAIETRDLTIEDADGENMNIIDVRDLTGVNDDANWTFPMIAKLIRDNRILLA